MLHEAEILGKTLNLPLLQLYREAGEIYYQKGDGDKAKTLFQLSDLTVGEQCERFANLNRMEDVRELLIKTLSNSQSTHFSFSPTFSLFPFHFYAQYHSYSNIII